MNEEKFSGKAELYDQYRPSYPKALIDFIFERTAPKTVADIGAGTGVFTKLLIGRGARVFAVEPNTDMREKLMAVGGITIFSNTAENTGLPEHSFDLVTVAQAFHWFDAKRFSAECKRIMNENGRLAIVWNSRGECPLVSERNELMKRLCPAYRSGHTGLLNEAEGNRYLREEYFSEVEYREFVGEMKYDLDGFIGDNLSRSYAPRPTEPNYQETVDCLKDIFTKYQKDGTVTIPQISTVFLGKLN